MGAYRNVDILNKAGAYSGDEYHKYICSSAVELVRSQCSSCHDICSVESYCKDIKMPEICANTQCSYNGVGASCDSRLHWTLLNHPDVANSATPCLTAGELVHAECPICNACSSKWWCAQQGSMGPKPAAAPHQSKELTSLVMPAKCGTICEFGGHSASCDKRMRWSMNHNPQVKSSANLCQAAGELVKSQCPVCGACSSGWWCAQPAQKKLELDVRMKFENVHIDGVTSHSGFTQSTPALLITAFIVAGIGFLVLCRAFAAAKIRVAASSGHTIAGYADPLCPESDDQGSSDSA